MALNLPNSAGGSNPPNYRPYTSPFLPSYPSVPPTPRKIKRVEYHDNGAVKSVEYED